MPTIVLEKSSAPTVVDQLLIDGPMLSHQLKLNQKHIL